MNKKRKKIVEACMPAFMMAHVIDSIRAAGVADMRMDIYDSVNKGAVAPMARVAQSFLKDTAQTVQNDGMKILKASNTDKDLLELLKACSLFAIKLAAEGLLEDTQAPAVLSGVALTLDADENEVIWGRCKRAQELCDAMLNHAQFLGYYIPEGRTIN